MIVCPNLGEGAIKRKLTVMKHQAGKQIITVGVCACTGASVCAGRWEEWKDRFRLAN